MTDPHICILRLVVHRAQREFGHADQTCAAPMHGEHETYAEEQARWERDDSAFARIVKTSDEQSGRVSKLQGAVMGPRPAGTLASSHSERQANDAAQGAQHALNADQTTRRRAATSRTSSQRRKSRSLKSTRIVRWVIRAREGQHHMRATFAIESMTRRPPGSCPSLSASTMNSPRRPRRAASDAARVRFRGPPRRNPVSNEPNSLEVE